MADKLRLDIELNINQSKLNAQTREVIRKARSLDREFNKIGGSGKDLSGVSRQLKNTQATMASLEAQTRRVTGALSDMGAKAKLTAQRFIIYNVIAGVIFKLTGAIRDGAAAFVDFDAALNRAEQILNPLISNVNELKTSVFRLGNEFGVTVKQVQEAQETFIRQGLALKEANELTRASLALSAATAIDAAAATEALTSVMRQFEIEASRALEIVDKFTATSINFAVTALDLAEGINRAGSAAATVGVQFEELTGFIAAAQEATRRGGRVIGTGLRTIFTRIFRAPAIEALEELGIRTRETTGEFRSASALLGDLSGKYTRLSNTQKIAVASTIAGQRQIATLLALLRNWDRAIDATNTALNSEGVALDLTRKRQEAVQVSLQRIQNQFVEFGTTIGNIFSSDVLGFVSTFSDLFEGLGDIIGSFSGSGVGSVFDSIAGSLFKWVGLIALSQLGFGKLITSTTSYLALNKSVNASLGERLKINRLTFDSEKRIFDIKKADNAASITRGAVLKNQTKILADQRKIAALTQQENKSQQLIVRELTSIESEKLQIQQRGLELRRLESQEIKLQAQEQGILLKQRTKEAQLRGQLDKLRLSPEAKSNNADAQLKIGDKLFQLSQKRSTLDTSTEAKRIEAASKILGIETRIKELKTELGGAKKLKDDGARRAQEAEILNEIRRKEGELTRINSALRKSGLEAAVDLEIQINTVRGKGIALADKEAARQAQQRKTAGSLGRLSQETTRNLANIEKERVATNNLINVGLTAQVDSAQRMIGMTNRANTARRTSVTRQQQIAKLTEQVTQNQKKLNLELDNQNKKLSKGGLGFGKAIGASIAIGVLTSSMRSLGDETDKSFSAAIGAVEGFGGALTTLAIASGPLGIALAGLQIVVTISKYFKDLEIDATASLKAAQEGLKRANDAARVFSGSISELSKLVEKVQLGKVLDLEDFERIDKKLDEVAKATNVAAGEMLGLREQITEAARNGDLDALREGFKEMEAFTTKQGLAKGTILDPEQIREALHGLEQAKNEIGKIEAQQQSIRGGSAGLLGTRSDTDTGTFGGGALSPTANTRAAIQSIRDAYGGLDSDIAAAKARQDGFTDTLKTFAAQGLKSFNSVIDPSKSFVENLKELGEEGIDVLKITGSMTKAWDIYIRKLKFVRSTSLDALVLNQTKEELDNIGAFGDAFAASNGDIRVTTKLLQDLGIAQGEAAEVGFEFKKGFEDTAAFDKFIAIIAKAQGVSEKSVRSILTDNKRLRQGVILTKDANDTLSITNVATGTTFTVMNKEIGAVANSLKGQLVPVALNAKQSTEDLGKAFAAASLIVDVFEQRLAASSRRIGRQTEGLQQLNKAVSATESNMSLLKDVMGEQIFRESIVGIDSLVDSVEDSGTAIGRLTALITKMDDINSDAAITISDKMNRAMEDGAVGATLFDARISEATEGVKRARIANLEYAQTIADIKEVAGGDFGFATSELATLANQRVQVELLAQAMQGLVAFRDKLNQGDKGSPILENDRKSAAAFLDTIKDILPGVDIDNIKKFIDFSGSRKTELVNSLKNLFSSIKIESAKIADPTLRTIVANFGTAIQASIEAAGNAGGKSATRVLSNALLKDVTRFTEASKTLFTAFLSSVAEFSNANAAQLATAINLTEKRLSEIAQATARGSFLPDFSGEDISILQQQFARIRTAVGKQRALLEAELKPIKEEIGGLITLTDDFKQGNLLNRSREENKKSLQDLAEARGKVSVAEQGLAALRVTEQKVTGSFLVQLGVQLDRFTTSQKEAFKAQNALAEAEAAVVKQRTKFALEEATTFEERIQLLENEASAIEQLTRDASGLGDIDVKAISKRLSLLTGTLIGEGRKKLNSVQIKGIEQQITLENQKLSLIQQINNTRLTSLRAERELIKEQAEAVRGLGTEFLKADDAQQKKIINSARAVEQFFGDLTPESLDSPAFQRKSTQFLTQTNDEMRNAVISQLERLKNVGGEVSPGVSAENVLRKLSESVVGAIFDSPLENIGRKQVELQTRIFGILQDSAKIRQIQLGLVVQSQNAARRSFDGLAARGAAGLADKDDETVKQARAVQASMALGQEEIIQINQARAVAEEQYADSAENAAIQNKNLVRTFAGLDTSIKDTGQSVASYQSRLVELRDAFIVAEDGFIEAQDAYLGALGKVGDELVKVAVAQSSYALTLELVRRENASITGAFATFRDEIAFLDTAFQSQINALAIVGAGEQALATLRVKLAQETLTVIEEQLSGFRDKALALFTGDLQAGDVQSQGAAAAIVASLASELDGIDLFNQLAKLPESLRKDAVAGLETAQTLGESFGGVSPDAILGEIIDVFGGITSGGDSVKSLEDEAARQRLIIAENSTSQLFASRTGLIAAQENLATSKEALIEAKAQKELAQLQLDSTQFGFETNQRAMDIVAEGMNSTASNTAQMVTFNSEMSGTLVEINQNMSRLADIGLSQSSINNDIALFKNAAQGTLSGGEVAGLLNAASREKRAMPHGSNLGVFNTSETVLTRSQMSRLRRGRSTPNAADGTGTVLNSEVTSLLTQISERLALLNASGINQQFDINIDNNRRVSIEGLAGLQTALQDIVLDATGELYTREEAESLQSVVMTVIQRLQETGQISAIGT